MGRVHIGYRAGVRGWVGLVLVVVGCGPGTVDSSGSGGASADGGSEDDGGGVSQSGSDDNAEADDTADTADTADTGDDPPPVDCDTVVPTTIVLGDVHRSGVSPSGCLFGHQVIGPIEGDSLRVVTLSAGEVEVVSDALTWKLPYSWGFVAGDAIVFREVNDPTGPLRRWDPETSEVVTLAEDAGDFLVTPDGSAVFWIDGATPGRLQVQPADGGPAQELAEIADLEEVYALADGTQGVLFTTPQGALAWADAAGEVNELATGVTLGGVDVVEGRAMVKDDADSSTRMIALRGDAPDLALGIFAPDEPGSVTPTATFSLDGRRMLLVWDVFDFDFGYIADRADLVILDEDTASADVSDCPGWALPSVHDEGVLCLSGLAGPIGTIEFLPHDGGQAQPLVDFSQWERRTDGAAAVGTRVRGAPIDGFEPELVQIVDISVPTPAIVPLGPGFLHDFAHWHRSAEPRWVTYGERPWLGFDQTDFDPVWRAYDLDTGEIVELPGVPVGHLPEHIVGGSVAYLGPDNDQMTLGPRVP